MAKLPDVRGMESLVDLFDAQAAQYADRPLLSAETEDGLDQWTGADLARRSRLAAWRLIAAGIKRGDRVLVWAPAGPALGAFYVAGWRAGIVVVPLDQRFGADVVARIAARADSTWIVVGDGIGPGSNAEVDALNRLSLADLTSDSLDDVPADYEAQMAKWPRPTRKDTTAIMFTSGTTGQPRGVMLGHRNALDPWELSMSHLGYRVLLRALIPKEMVTVSVMPMSHIFGIGEFVGAIMFGGRIVYPQGRSPRALLDAMRRHRPTSMAVAPRFLELFWTQMLREITAAGGLESFERRRQRAARLPYFMRRRLFRQERALLGGRLKAFSSGAAYLPPDVQQAWESIGIPVMQGYGATECGAVASTSFFRHPIGKVGRKVRTANVELAADGEILVSGPGVADGYWRDPEATALSFDEKGRYHTGDIGRFDEKGNLVLLGRKKNIIVLSNGLNVYPEDIEAQLHLAGLGDTVVLETEPGRIGAVILDPEAELAAVALPEDATSDERRAALRERIEAAVQLANSRLTTHERIDTWKIWPEPDFPRTHTQKIRRDPVRMWAAGPSAVPLPVTEGVGAEA
ncbi:MAG TPA: AMP-binding protein [Candidatus Limnocylindrales bacterium]|nr:AMP-binding protein [Candidatus Limnocylindrales bacterium]